MFMAASIILLSAWTTRLVPVEIFLSRDVDPVSAMFGFLLGHHIFVDVTEKDRFARVAAIAS